MANSKQIARDTLGAAALCLVWKKETARKEFTEKLASCVFPITSDEITPAFHVNPSITMDSSYINCTAVVDGQRCGCAILITTLDSKGEPVKVPGFCAFSLTVCVRCLMNLHTTTKSPKSGDKGTKVADVGLVLLALKDNAIPIDALALMKKVRGHSRVSQSQLSLRKSNHSPVPLEARVVALLKLVGLSDSPDRSNTLRVHTIFEAAIIDAHQTFSVMRPKWRSTHTKAVRKADRARATDPADTDLDTTLRASLRLIFEKSWDSQPHNEANNDERAYLLRAFGRYLCNLRLVATKTTTVAAARRTFVEALPLVYKMPVLMFGSALCCENISLGGATARYTFDAEGRLHEHLTLSHFVYTIAFTQCLICMPVPVVEAWIEEVGNDESSVSDGGTLFPNDATPSLEQFMGTLLFGAVFRPRAPHPGDVVPVGAAAAKQQALAINTFGVGSGAVSRAHETYIAFGGRNIGQKGSETKTKDVEAESKSKAQAAAPHVTLADIQELLQKSAAAQDLRHEKRMAEQAQKHAAQLEAMRLVIARGANTLQVPAQQPQQAAQNVTGFGNPYGVNAPSNNLNHPKAPRPGMGHLRPDLTHGTRAPPLASPLGMPPPPDRHGQHRDPDWHHGYQPAAGLHQHGQKTTQESYVSPGYVGGAFQAPPFSDPSYRQIHGCFGCNNPHCAVSQGPCPFAEIPDEDLTADSSSLVILSGCGEFSTKTILNYKEQLTGVALLLDGEFTARGGTGAYFPIGDEHEFIQEIETGVLYNADNDVVSSKSTTITGTVDDDHKITSLKVKKEKTQLMFQILGPKRLNLFESQVKVAIDDGMARMRANMGTTAYNTPNYNTFHEKYMSYKVLKKPFALWFKDIRHKMEWFKRIEDSDSRVLQLRYLWMYVNWTVRLLCKKRIFLCRFLDDLWNFILRYKNVVPFTNPKHIDHAGILWNNSMYNHVNTPLQLPGVDHTPFTLASPAQQFQAQISGTSRRKAPATKTKKKDAFSGKIPAYFLAGGPDSVYIKYAGLCLKCHAATHTTTACPIKPASCSQAQKQLLADAKRKNGVMNRPRSIFCEKARKAWRTWVQKNPGKALPKRAAVV